jgi:hypothetical protein
MRPISTATTNLPGMAGVGAAMAAAASPKNRNLGSNSAAPVAPSAPTPMLASAPVAISVGAAATAIHPYEATLDDELTLAPGMKIAVKEIFDDGWASGTVISGGSAAQMDNVPRKFPVVSIESFVYGVLYPNVALVTDTHNRSASLPPEQSDPPPSYSPPPTHRPTRPHYVVQTWTHAINPHLPFLHRLEGDVQDLYSMHACGMIDL